MRAGIIAGPVRVWSDEFDHANGRRGRHHGAGGQQADAGVATQAPGACSAWHDHQMIRTDDTIAFAADGRTHHRHANPRSASAAWPFDAPQCLLLNIAIGGVLGGAVDHRIFR